MSYKISTRPLSDDHIKVLHTFYKLSDTVHLLRVEDVIKHEYRNDKKQDRKVRNALRKLKILAYITPCGYGQYKITAAGKRSCQELFESSTKPQTLRCSLTAEKKKKLPQKAKATKKKPEIKTRKKTITDVSKLVKPEFEGGNGVSEEASRLASLVL